MSVQFYPEYADKMQHFRDIMCLDISSSNAIGVFAMLGVEGTGEQGTVGSLTPPQISNSLLHMDGFLRDYKWNQYFDAEQMRRYTLALSLIMGYCLGNNCNFNWS